LENSIKVFGKEKCMQCRMVKSLLETQGTDFTYIDIEKNESAMHELKSAGLTTVPVTKNRDGSYIIGFAVGQLRNL